MAVSIITGTGAVGRVLLNDIAMTEASVFAFDFSDARCWAGGNATAGATLTNLLAGAGNATVGTSTLTFNTDGFRFSVGSTTQKILLPDSAKFAGADGFAVAMFLTAETQTQSAKSRVAGYFNPVDNTGPWGVYVQSNTFNFLVNSQRIAASISPTALGLGKIHHVALVWINAGDDVTPNWRARVYLDGALFADEAATYDTLQAPSAASEAAIGDLHGTGTGSSGYWIGKFCRVLGWDLDGVSEDEMLETLTLDREEHTFADPA